MTGWWSQERIASTLTQTYIEKELGSKRSQDNLHRVLAFGDGLTDDTYLDWVLERSPRFFLILNDIGVPDKIFDVIDRSFDDDDLPLSQDALWELNLFGTTSETLDKKFYRQQFYFLIHELEPGGHVDYSNWDVVPIESSIRKPSIPAAVQTTDRVCVHERLYTRKRIPTSGRNGIDRIRFIMHLKSIAALQHRHLVTVWATYSQHDFNHVLLQPSCEVTLKHILEDKDQAKFFKSMEKHERRHTLLTWVHCLMSALAYLHSHGFMHKSIRPSSITIDQNNVAYLNDYNALRVLDVEEAPNPYCGEIYDFAPPENWRRKPTLHETTPVRTLAPSGGRTSRRVPKSPPIESESRRPSVISQDLDTRTHSRSQNSSSESSTSDNLRPRNALITTFAPPDSTPASLPNTYYPGDVFSLTAVILTMLSYLLGHGPKSFATHRSRLNRQAGRGNGPPDASFHKNLKQVEKWVLMLAKQAGQKEKKDQKLWGSVVELVNICGKGMAKEPSDRPSARYFEKSALGWVDFGIGRRKKCECSEEDHLTQETEISNPVLAAQRNSVFSWSKISERISSGQFSEDPPLQPEVRPRRSLSKRLTMDRAPELQRSRSNRPSSSMSGGISTLAPTEEESIPSKTSLHRRQSDKIRSAMRHAVQSTALQPVQVVPRSHDPPVVVRQSRSAFHPKHKQPSQISAGRRNTHPLHPPPRPIQEEPLAEAGNYDDLVDAEQSASVYSLQPRRQTHPLPRSTAACPTPSPNDFPVPPTPTSVQPTTPTSGSTMHAPVIHGIPLYDDVEDAYGGVYEYSDSRAGRLDRCASYASTEVWGLGNALDDDDIKGRNVKPDRSGAKLSRLDWPLPPGPSPYRKEQLVS